MTRNSSLLKITHLETLKTNINSLIEFLPQLIYLVTDITHLLYRISNSKVKKLHPSILYKNLSTFDYHYYFTINRKSLHRMFKK